MFTEMDLRSTQVLVTCLFGVAGSALLGVLFINLRHLRKRFSNGRGAAAMGILGVILSLGFVVWPALTEFWPGTHPSTPRPVSSPVAPAPPPTPVRTTFTPDEIRIGEAIFAYANAAAVTLFFGGLIGAIIGAVKGWRFRHIWLLTAFGMTGAYLIWDLGVFIALGAYLPGISRHVVPKGWADQPGTVAAFFASIVWAFIVDCVAGGIRRLWRLWIRRRDTVTPS